MRAEAIARALGGYKRNGHNHLCRCPAHKDSDPSLSLRDGPDGKLLVKCFAGCDPLTILAKLPRSDQAERSAYIPPVKAPADDKTADIASALKLWGERREAAGSPVDAYLKSRGLTLPFDCPALAFHPACPKGSERLPAMLGLMTDAITGAPCGLHRTFLKPDGTGKADVKPQKMMLGRAKGAVIRLSPDDAVTTGLGIVEGIENGLAIIGLGWSPVWSVLSANFMTEFPVLPGIEALTIFADHDDAGQTAARACAVNWTAGGRQVAIRTPSRPGADWNDAILEAA